MRGLAQGRGAVSGDAGPRRVETRERASRHSKAAESLAGWILEDKDGDWSERPSTCVATRFPKLSKVMGATHPDTLDARSQLAQICWSATTKDSRKRVEEAGLRVGGTRRGGALRGKYQSLQRYGRAGQRALPDEHDATCQSV